MRKKIGLRAALMFSTAVCAFSVRAIAQETPPATSSTPSSATRASSVPKSHRMPVMHKISYRCDGGLEVVVYLRERNARVTFQEKSYAMKQVESGSGTKYSSGAIVWWSKGDEGFLEDDRRPGQPVKMAENCKLVRATVAGRAEGSSVVSGTVAYRERMAMPENAVLTMQLQDVSNSDAPPEVIAEQRFTFAGHQVPLPFELHYEAAKIDPAHTYALTAKIAVAGQVMFLNTTTYDVITHGNPTKVDMSVQMVEGQTDGVKQ
jgi:putative lipoprotein